MAHVYHAPCRKANGKATAHAWPFLCIDELDKGLHYSVRAPVWRWIATISGRRQIQIFATTHCEACIQSACRAFPAANGDGLRIIRLDRRAQGRFATIHARSLVEAAAEMGVETRG